MFERYLTTATTNTAYSQNQSTSPSTSASTHTLAPTRIDPLTPIPRHHQQQPSTNEDNGTGLNSSDSTRCNTPHPCLSPHDHLESSGDNTNVYFQSLPEKVIDGGRQGEEDIVNEKERQRQRSRQFGSVSSALTAVDRNYIPNKNKSISDLENGRRRASTFIDSDSVYPRAEEEQVHGWWREEVSSDRCHWLAVYALFVSGYTSCISFSACYVWCGFQTGNLAQLGLALARHIPHSHTTSFQPLDVAAFISLMSFIAGVLFGHCDALPFFRTKRSLSPYGHNNDEEDSRGRGKNRGWLVTTACIQVLLCLGAVFTAWFEGTDGLARSRDHPAWDNTLGSFTLALISAAMGLQGTVCKKLMTPMNASVVATTTVVELFSDPLLPLPRSAPSRDIRIAGLTALLLGAFTSRALVQVSAMGDMGAIAVAVGLRVLMGVGWGVVGTK